MQVLFKSWPFTSLRTANFDTNTFSKKLETLQGDSDANKKINVLQKVFCKISKQCQNHFWYKIHIQSKLAIGNFLVVLKLFLNTNLFLIKPFLIAKFDCSTFLTCCCRFYRSNSLEQSKYQFKKKKNMYLETWVLYTATSEKRYKTDAMHCVTQGCC